jgi:prepilin-type processing-associated H-X9-DG protein
LQVRDGTWQKTYGFADGHAEIHTEPDGNFDDWESQHIIPPPPPSQ